MRMFRQLLLTINAFVIFLSLNVAADTKEPCRTPILAVTDYSLLRSVEYFGDSGTAKKAKVGDKFSLQCARGALEIQSGSTIKFNSEAMPKEAYAGKSSFFQQGVKASSKIGAEVSISDLGYILGIADTKGFSYVLENRQEIDLIGELEFYEDGNLSSAEAASSGEISIFGENVSWDEGDNLNFTPFRTLISKSALKRLKGDWTVSSSQGNLKLSFDYNDNGEFEIFLLSGNSEALHPDIWSRLIIQPLSSERFYLPDTDHIDFNLRGEVFKQNGDNSVREEFPIPVTLTQSGDSMKLAVFESSLTFERDSLVTLVLNRLIALAQTSVALIVFLFTAIFFFIIFGAFFGKIKDASPDRRYTKKPGGGLKGGGTIGTLLGGGLLALAVPIAIYFFVLDYLGISGPVAYMSFFLF